MNRNTRFFLLLLSITVIVLGYLFMPWVTHTGTYLYEDISFTLNPNAERAYEHGNRHFDGQDVGNYDVWRAATFFYKVAALDPNLLYAHHQLARIAFLRGDFGPAMAHRHANGAPRRRDAEFHIMYGDRSRGTWVIMLIRPKTPPMIRSTPEH